MTAMRINIGRISLIIAIAVAGRSVAQGAPPTPVRVDTVRIESVMQTRLVTGELHAPSRSRVAVREPGLVSALPVEVGLRVESGDLIARLDDARLQIQIAQKRGRPRPGRSDSRRADCHAEQAEA